MSFEMDKMKLIDEEFEKVANVLQAEKSDIEMVKKKKEDFVNFVAHSLQNSKLTGIPQIAQAKDASKRVIRSLVFCLCIAGFIYQSYSFMSLYWDYDVVMDVQVITPFYTEPPAITVCHQTGIKSDEMCKDSLTETLRQNFSLKCETVKQVMDLHDEEDLNCNCNPRLCDEYGNVQNWSWLAPPFRADAMPYEVIKPFLLTPRDMVYPCQMTNLLTRGGEMSPICSNPEFIKEVPCANTGHRESCATFMSKYGEPNSTWPEIAIGTEIHLGIKRQDKYVGEKESINPIYVSIHDPRTIVNPFKHGFQLTPGLYYDVRVNKVEKKLLPAPYKTDCIDYLEMWKLRGGKGPLNLKDCLLESQVNTSLALYGCVVTNIYFVGDAPRCPVGSINIERLTKVYEVASEHSEMVCKPACDDSFYDLTITTRPYSNDACEQRETLPSHVALYFDTMEITRYSYSPKYQDIETFSYVGGYIGMWLAISLVVVFDFLETVFLMMKYPLRRFRKFKNKRKVQNQIIHGHLHQ